MLAEPLQAVCALLHWPPQPGPEKRRCPLVGKCPAPPVRTLSSQGQRDAPQAVPRDPGSRVGVLAGTAERPLAAAGEAAGQMMDKAVRGPGAVGHQPTALQPRPFPSTPCRHLGRGLTVFRCNLPFLPSSTGPGRVPSDQSPVREVGHPLPFTVRETDDSVTRWVTRGLARSQRPGTAGRGQALPFTQSLGRPSSTCPSIRVSLDRCLQSRGPRSLADAGRKGCDQAT